MSWEARMKRILAPSPGARYGERSFLVEKDRFFDDKDKF